MADQSITVSQAIIRINEAHSFYRNEMLRVETIFSSLLLPASLTIVSALSFTSDRLVFILAQSGLIAFFLTYLAILFLDLLGLERREHQVTSLQRKLYATPTESDCVPLSTYSELNTEYGTSESKMNSTIMMRPTIKIFVSMIVAVIVILATLAY
jgi:hypothetical protein